MMKRVSLCFLLLLMSCISAGAQQAQMQPLVFYYDYAVNPGKEEQFLDLVKTVGAPVRDKLMADGVVLAWGVESPLLRVPGDTTHSIWYAVADWAGVEKVDTALRTQISKLNDEAAKSGVGKKGTAPASSVAARLLDSVDISKTHDYLCRNLVFNASSNAPAGVLPYTRYFFFKVKPGKGGEFRKAWEKYNKPIIDKLLADGVILAYGLAIEEVRTDGDFTHFSWFSMKDLSSMDKFRSAFLADREHRSQEEQQSITDLFTSLTDPDASRSEVVRALIFHAAGMK